MSAPTTRLHWVAVVAAGLVAIQLGIRAVVAFEGYFYWDDLILVGRAGTQPILSGAYLFDDHDGHVMPGAFLVAGVITRIAPLDWLWPALSLVILQLVASLALLRAPRHPRLRKAGLCGVHRGKAVFTTVTDPADQRPADSFNRQFSAAGPNRLWVADITFVRT